MNLSRRCVAEFFGTFWLVFGGCGSAVLAAGFPLLGIGFVGVSLAFGLTVLTMAYALGSVSGGHFNPAVTLGLIAGKRFPARDFLPYAGSQVAGAIAAAGTLFSLPAVKRVSARRAALLPTATACTRLAATRWWRAWSQRSC